MPAIKAVSVHLSATALGSMVSSFTLFPVALRTVQISCRDGVGAFAVDGPRKVWKRTVFDSVQNWLKIHSSKLFSNCRHLLYEEKGI